MKKFLVLAILLVSFEGMAKELIGYKNGPQLQGNIIGRVAGVDLVAGKFYSINGQKLSAEQIIANKQRYSASLIQPLIGY